MAENESLDIDSKYGRRWKAVVYTAFAGESAAEVGRVFKLTLHAALKRAIEQLGNRSVNLLDFLANRFCPKTTKQLLRQCQNHQYAQLLVNVLAANPESTDGGALRLWLYAVTSRRRHEN